MNSMAACVIDTSVLQKANAPLEVTPKEGRIFRRRLRLLGSIRTGELSILISAKLHAEYRRQVHEPRNDFVRAFLELLASPNANTLWNWATPWGGDKREAVHRCRYPREDVHVLRTAVRSEPTTIYSEEQRMLKADKCIYRAFRVHIRHP